MYRMGSFFFGCYRLSLLLARCCSVVLVTTLSAGMIHVPSETNFFFRSPGLDRGQSGVGIALVAACERHSSLISAIGGFRDRGGGSINLS